MKTLIIIILNLIVASVLAQNALDGIIVEEYFSTDQFSSMAPEWEGEEKVTTYRIFVDLAEGYSLQAIFGNEKHRLLLGSDGLIFNHPARGWESGAKINSKKFNNGALILDSYLTMGAISNSHSGILKDEDKDGSYLSNLIKEPLEKEFQALLKSDETLETPLLERDGMTKAWPNDIRFIEMQDQLDQLLKDKSAKGDILISNGAWAVIGGVKGPTESNRVFIGQVTTDGQLSFELNIQVGGPNGEVEQYVARQVEPNENEVSALRYPEQRP